MFKFYFITVLLMAQSIYAAPFNFVVMGDNRPSMGSSQQPEIFKTIIKEINQYPVDFVIHSGDVIAGYGGRDSDSEQLKAFMREVQKIKSPVYHVMGNHEADAVLWKELIKQPLFYSFTRKNCHFIILNSYYTSLAGSKKTSHKISDVQLTWLKNDLEKNKNIDHTFVITHEPLYPTGHHKGRSLDKYIEHRDMLANMFKRYGAIVICGHEHIYKKSIHDGLIQIISGGAGAPLNRGGFYHYLNISIDKKKIKLTVFKPGRKIFHEEIIDADKNEKMLFSFVQVSDTHIVAGKPNPIVKKGIKAINALIPQPKFVVDSGDLIDGPPEKAYDKYNELFATLKVPHYSVIGNHDYRKKIYQIKRGKLNYSFDVKPYHFIVLDNIEFKPETDVVYGGGFPKASIAWLSNHLKSIKPETPLIFFTHAALFRPNSFSKDLPGDVYNYQTIISLIKPFNVIAFFAGHAHANAKMTKNNINFITTGCMSDNRANHNCEVGFRIVDVYKNSIKSIYVPLIKKQTSNVTKKSFSLPLFSQKIKIDGDLLDWPNNQIPINFDKTNYASLGKPTLTDFSMKNYLGWDKKFLYFAAVVTDDYISCLDMKSDFPNSDYYRLYLSMPGRNPKNNLMTSKDYCFIFTPTSPSGKPMIKLHSYQGFEHKKFPLDKVKLSVKKTLDGYVIEGAIPWNTLNWQPKIGAIIGFNIVAGDTDKNGKRTAEYTTTKIPDYWRNPQVFNQLILKATKHPKLIAWWSFDKNSQNNVEDKINKITASRKGALKWTKNRFNVEASALNFQQATDMLSIDNQKLLNLDNELTISLWMKTSSAKGLLIYNGAYGGKKAGYYIGFYSGFLRAQFEDGKKYLLEVKIPEKKVIDNKWHRITVVFSNKKLKIFLDGNKIQEKSLKYDYSIINKKSPFKIGKNFEGVIDDLKIFNTILTNGEINNL